MGKRKKHMTPAERAAARRNPGDGAVAGREAKAAAPRPGGSQPRECARDAYPPHRYHR